MRRKILMVCGMYILFVMTVMAKDPTGSIARIFSTGQVEQLSVLLAEKIIFIEINERSELSGPQCQKKLSAFFTANKPKEFKLLHQSTQGETGFLIGKLVTAPQIFRIHCLFKTENEECKINQIRIDIFHE